MRRWREEEEEEELEGPGSGVGAELGPGACPSYAGGGAKSGVTENLSQNDIHNNIPKINRISN